MQLRKLVRPPGRRSGFDRNHVRNSSLYTRNPPLRQGRFRRWTTSAMLGVAALPPRTRRAIALALVAAFEHPVDLIPRRRTRTVPVVPEHLAAVRDQDLIVRLGHQRGVKDAPQHRELSDRVRVGVARELGIVHDRGLAVHHVCAVAADHYRDHMGQRPG